MDSNSKSRDQNSLPGPFSILVVLSSITDVLTLFVDKSFDLETKD